ncbi:MAG: DegT/DnrJ/EryC1/StrS family aminotransferase [Candidatus Micrarchaeia archaeon]
MISIAKPLVGAEELEEIRKVIESGALTQGPAVKEFEDAVARYEGYKHCISASSGTAALHVALLSLGVGKGDEVIIPDFTFIATANAVRYTGAKPVFVDVNARTFNIEPNAVKQAITPKTKAVIPVSLYGQCYDVDALREACAPQGVKIVSDNCQAIGAEYNNSRNLRDSFATLSFYPTKNMTTGEGGALLTDDDALAEDARLWRNIGQKGRYEYVHSGYNYRMSSIHAAIGIAQLRKLDGWTAKRRENARLYNELLEGAVETPFVDSRCKHVYHQYTIKSKRRDKLQEKLKLAGIGSGVYYPAPLHSLSIFKGRGACPVTKALCKTVLSLPVHPALSEADIRLVAETIRKR